MAVIATGFFDGVHVGHRLVIETLVEASRRRGEESIVLTFWPHPRLVLNNDPISLRLLNSMKEKQALLKQLGVDRVEVIPFTEEFATMSAKDYLEKIVKEKYGATAVLLGYDNRLGGDGLNSDQTKSIAKECGLEVITTDKVSAVGIAVSSTKIRRALASGDVVAASKCLGYEYALTGIVVHGNKIGRTLGYPTANLEIDEPLKLIPASGAYLCRVNVCGEEWMGMTNIGFRPTIDRDDSLTIETNIFDFSADIYDQEIKISFIDAIREERKFDSLEGLTTQLKSDEQWCRKFLLSRSI